MLSVGSSIVENQCRWILYLFKWIWTHIIMEAILNTFVPSTGNSNSNIWKFGDVWADPKLRYCKSQIIINSWSIQRHLIYTSIKILHHLWFVINQLNWRVMSNIAQQWFLSRKWCYEMTGCCFLYQTWRTRKLPCHSIYEGDIYIKLQNVSAHVGNHYCFNCHQFT